MTTGIYKLTFRSGKVYIGQSVDIETRWKQHYDKFSKGTAAKPMQVEFNREGFPNPEVILECHKDHLNMMEAMYINAYILSYGTKVLNSTIPKDYSNKEIIIIHNNEEYLKYSSVELIDKLVHNKNNVTTLEEEIQTLREDGIRLPEDLVGIEEENTLLKKQVDTLITINQHLSKRANMSWLERLLS
jgi:hypothetical protein